MATTANHVWRPSGSRLIVVEGFLPGPRGLPTRCVPLRWPAKDPADVLDYEFDIAPALAGNDGDAIATVDVVIQPSNPGDLQLVSTAADGARAILWLEGGQAGTTYTVSLTIGTQAGRTLSRSVLLPVIGFTAQADSASALVTDAGAALLDEDGGVLELGG